MNTTNNNQANQNDLPPQNPPIQPVYTEPKSQQILRETGTVVATVGMLAGLIATLKSLFRKK